MIPNREATKTPFFILLCAHDDGSAATTGSYLKGGETENLSEIVSEAREIGGDDLVRCLRIDPCRLKVDDASALLAEAWFLAISDEINLQEPDIPPFIERHHRSLERELSAMREDDEEDRAHMRAMSHQSRFI